MTDIDHKNKQLTEDEIFTIQCAVENMRSADKDDRIIEARWRIAYKLEQIVIKLSK